jgi:transposase
MPYKYGGVKLNKKQREWLLNLLHQGESKARTLTRARVLLKAAEGWTDGQMAEALDVGTATVCRVRQRFVQEGMGSALYEKPRPGQKPKLSGKQQAYIVALSCSKAPAGHTHWALRLLAKEVVRMKMAESISPVTIMKILKKKRAETMASSGMVHR